MLVGMGTVFVFLSLLVLAMVAMSALAQRFVVSQPEDDVTSEELAAISAAVIRHQQLKHQQHH